MCRILAILVSIRVDSLPEKDKSLVRCRVFDIKVDIVKSEETSYRFDQLQWVIIYREFLRNFSLSSVEVTC